jgi:hypothetical protein
MIRSPLFVNLGVDRRYPTRSAMSSGMSADADHRVGRLGGVHPWHLVNRALTSGERFTRRLAIAGCEAIQRRGGP